jgi:hypothetical protein
MNPAGVKRRSDNLKRHGLNFQDEFNCRIKRRIDYEHLKTVQIIMAQGPKVEFKSLWRVLFESPVNRGVYVASNRFFLPRRQKDTKKHKSREQFGCHLHASVADVKSFL